MNIYSYESYTEALSEAFRLRKESEPALTLSGVANACLMQPSYLTNVLKGRAELNSDQLYRVCERLGLKDEAYEYLLLLLELKRASYEKKRVHFQQKIRKLQTLHLRAERNLSVAPVQLSAEQTEKYYLDPYIQLVHIYLSIPKGTKTLEGLAKKFALSLERAAQVMNTLEEIRYVQKKNGKYEALVSGRHLPRESAMLRPHQVLLRSRSLDQMQRLTSDQVYSFSATISTSPATRTQLQAEFLKFLKTSEKLVKSSEAERLYQINFDLFPWETDEP